MKPAFTLIETLIALVISGILFTTIFSLTQLSLNLGHENMRLQVALGRELGAINAYDKARLSDKTMAVPTFFIEPKHEAWGITAESSLGYRGVLLP